MTGPLNEIEIDVTVNDDTAAGFASIAARAAAFRAAMQGGAGGGGGIGDLGLGSWASRAVLLGAPSAAGATSGREIRTILAQLRQGGAAHQDLLLTVRQLNAELRRTPAEQGGGGLGTAASAATAAGIAAAVAERLAATGAGGGGGGGGGAGAGILAGLAGAAGGRFGIGAATAGLLTFGNVLTVTHLALAIFGAQIVADAAGITAFGLAAYHSIAPAVTAASSVANMTTQYAGLDRWQKAAALSIQSFMDHLKQANEGGIFGVFYQGLSLVQSQLGKGNTIVTQATNAFGDFIGMLKADFASRTWAEVFAGSTGIIRKDLDALFGLINAGINIIPGLFHNFNFIGLAAINAASGILRLTAAVLTWNPALTKAVALAGLLYGAYKVLWAGLGAGAGPIQAAVTGLSGFASRQAAVVAQTRAASTYMSAGAATAASYRAGIFGISSAALAATGVLAGFAGGIALAVIVSHGFIDQNHQMINTLTAEDRAVGNNAAGYQKLSQQLSAQIGVVRQNIATHNLVGQAMGVEQAKLSTLTNAQQAASTTFQTISKNAQLLGGNLGLTTKQVYAFAKATGVDLTQALTIGGTQFVIDAGKIGGYAQAVRLSHNPLSQFKVDARLAFNPAKSLTDQITALSAAFNSLVTPQLNVIQGAINLKQSEQAATAAIQASNGVVGKATTAQQQAGTAIITAANAAVAQSNNIKAMGGSARAVIAPLQNFVSWLSATGARGAYVAQVLALIRKAEDGLYSKTVNIAVNTISTTTTRALTGHAAGTPSAAPGWAIVGERGPELVQMAGGERITPLSYGGSRWMGGGGPTVVLQLASTGSAFDRFMLNWLQNSVRVVGGGDVQVAFGAR